MIRRLKKKAWKLTVETWLFGIINIFCFHGKQREIYKSETNSVLICVLSPSLISAFLNIVLSKAVLGLFFITLQILYAKIYILSYVMTDKCIRPEWPMLNKNRELGYSNLSSVLANSFIVRSHSPQTWSKRKQDME